MLRLIGLALIVGLFAGCAVARPPERDVPASVEDGPARSVGGMLFAQDAVPDGVRAGDRVGDRQRLLHLRISAADDAIDRLARERAVIEATDRPGTQSELAAIDAEIARLGAIRAAALREIDDIQPDAPF